MDAQATEAPPPPFHSAAPTGHGRFLGESHTYWHILSRDAVSLVATLGLYRFWVANDIRRFLWSNTEIAGDELEYTGDPQELFVGFLVLVVVLCPLFAAFSLAARIAVVAVAPQFFDKVNLSALVLLGLLAVLALYQGRRYRLAHTIYRGLRFRQTGSAWLYALLTVGWFIVNLLTLGLTYPVARKHLERYKMRHAYYGDLQGDFQAPAGRLFKTGFLLWLIVLVPAVAMILSPGDKMIDRAFIWLVCAGLAVYPAFHANALRWRISGMRFGTLAMESPFSTWGLYKAYLRFFGVMVLFAILVLLVIAFVQNQIVPRLPANPDKLLSLVFVIFIVLAYFIVITVTAFVYQATVRFTLWRLIVNALTLTGLDALDGVKAQPGWSPHHEGRIGGALSIGGF